MDYTALQRSDLIRAEYQAEITIYDPSMIVFVDESGTDQRNATQRFRYALRGYCPRSFKLLSRGKRLSTIAALTVSQLLCYVLHEQNAAFDSVTDVLAGVETVYMCNLISKFYVYMLGGTLWYIMIGASLSEPHTSVTSLHTCVCMLACLLACLDRPLTENLK